ncbi:MAG TPA: hypothetical protein VF139_09625 [Candidatus Polarisedimenticolaceae bacterium]
MTKFLMLIGAALVLAAISFVLYRRAPRGWTRIFLGLAAISAIAFPVGAVLHNAIDALFHVEEPVFFLIAVIGAPVGVLVGLVGAAITAYTGGLARR